MCFSQRYAKLNIYDTSKKSGRYWDETVFVLVVILALIVSAAACKSAPVAATDPSASENTLAQQESTVDPEKVEFTPIVSSEDYFHTDFFSPTETPVKIQYLFHQPIRDAGKSYPLIIYLHGKGETLSASNLGTGQLFINTLIDMENASEQYSAYTLVPITPPGQCRLVDGFGA